MPGSPRPLLTRFLPAAFLLARFPPTRSRRNAQGSCQMAIHPGPPAGRDGQPGSAARAAARPALGSLIADLFQRGAAQEEIPERVRQELRAEQHRGDILMSVVQLVLCAIFVALYTLSRSTSPADAPFMPVPWALAAYAAFSVAKFRLAWRGPVAAPVQIASILADMTLLLGLIWSFHIQYGQTAAFYLKAPTLLYVFIFIALRSLRMEAVYVVVAGAAAAAGWLALVLYAALAGEDGMAVTRDFVVYMTSSTILWGAEIDKMVSIGLVTGLVALSIARARRMLHRSVREAAAARDLRRFFDPRIASRITGSEHLLQPGHGERRDATMLFVDLRGFTALSRAVDPDALVRILTDYHASLIPAIRAHGGNIDKFLGDGIMASFGATSPSSSHAAEALRATEALVAAADAWLSRMRREGTPVAGVGIGIASGSVVFGCIGDGARLEYTVIGEAANLAAKLEKATKTLSVPAIVLAATYDLALEQGYAPRAAASVRRKIEIAGADGPVDVVLIGT
jgi:adenylate cyclase